MIKVCHMTSVHESLDDRIFYKECISLSDDGYEVFIVASGENFTKNNINIVGVDNKPINRFKRALFFTKKIYRESLQLDADIYHFHDPELLLYGLKLKKKGKLVIFDSHENYPLQIKAKPYLPKPIRNICAWIYMQVETYVCKRIDGVIFPCTSGGKNIFEGRAARVAFVNNCTRLSEFYEQYTETANLKGDKICYTGNISYERGATQLVKAANIAGVGLILAGDFSCSAYQNELINIDRSNRIEYRGYLNREGVLNLYSEALIGMAVLLNVGQYYADDNLPTKVYEYMALGIPTIISDMPYAQKVNDKYDCFVIVKPDDEREIADAILYLLQNPEVARQKGTASRRAIKEEFNWDVEEKKMLELYDKVLLNDGR